MTKINTMRTNAMKTNIPNGTVILADCLRLQPA